MTANNLRSQVGLLPTAYYTQSKTYIGTTIHWPDYTGLTKEKLVAINKLHELILLLGTEKTELLLTLVARKQRKSTHKKQKAGS